MFIFSEGIGQNFGGKLVQYWKPDITISNQSRIVLMSSGMWMTTPTQFLQTIMITNIERHLRVKAKTRISEFIKYYFTLKMSNESWPDINTFNQSHFVLVVTLEALWHPLNHLVFFFCFFLILDCNLIDRYGKTPLQVSLVCWLSLSYQ